MHDVSGSDQGAQDVQVIAGGRESLQIFLRTPHGTKIVRVAPHATLQEAVLCIRFDAPGGTWKAHCQARCIQPSDQLSAHNIRDRCKARPPENQHPHPQLAWYSDRRGAPVEHSKGCFMADRG